MAKRTGAPELLAPAGGWEQLEHAIRFGADAVYLACDRFGMRQRASNFALDDMPAVVAYAHGRGVAVHVTCNTLMHERDFDELPRYLRAWDEAGVDAILVSDLGALACVRELAPHAAIHVSTQASVSNAAAARVWHELGAKRIVCAREMSLEAIARMRDALPPELELECFVHGSMCMAVSGRCLISDFMTGRSATNGHCTQPCRWEYALVEEKRPGQYFPVEEDATGTFIMNAHDLNMLAHVHELAAAGVDSLKIEGRNKKAFYVATVVNAYRQVLDGADPRDWEGELDTVSHRPYGTGFYFGPAHQAWHSDAYLRYYDWAADVLGASAGTGAALTSGRGTKPAPSGSSPLPHSAEAPRGPGAGAGAALTGEAGGVLACVRCRNKFGVGDELEVLSPHEPVRKVRVRTLWLLAPEGHLDAFDQPVPAGRPLPVQVANRAMDRYLVQLDGPVRARDILRIARPGRTTARRFRSTGA